MRVNVMTQLAWTFMLLLYILPLDTAGKMIMMITSAMIAVIGMISQAFIEKRERR